MISDVARLMRTVFDRRVRRLGLTRAQWLALTRLHRRPGASQSELADMMEVEKATVGRLIDRLEAKGWVERRAQAGDRRINRVYLTAEAERVHKRIWRIAEATVDDALAELSPREAGQLLKLLGRVKSRLVDIADNPAPQPKAKDGDRRDRASGASRPSARSARKTSWWSHDDGFPAAARDPRVLPLRLDLRRNLRPILLIAVPALVILAALTFWLYRRALCLDRERLRQGRHRPDRQRGAGPRRRAHHSRPCRGRAGRGARAPRSGALQAGARQGRGRARFGAHHGGAAQDQPARDQGRAQGSREPDALSRGPGQAPARPGRARREPGDQARAGRQRRAAGARPRRHAARAHCPRGGLARRQSRPADRSAIRWCARRSPRAIGPRSISAYTEIKAPRAGTVVNFKLQPGEQIKAQTPLFSIVSDRRPWVEANFKETDLTNVVVGQKATVVLDIYPDITWDAEVESISPATGAEFAILPPQNASGNWVKVVQRLPGAAAPDRAPGRAAPARRHDRLGQHRHAALAQPLQHLRRRHGDRCQAAVRLNTAYGRC